LSNALANESAERDDGDNRIGAHLANELKKLDEILNDHREYGETSEKKIFEAIKNSVTDIKATLEEERIKRFSYRYPFLK
jgi:hypothetical protein